MNELKMVQNVEMLFENRIILYGASSYGTKMLNQLKDIGADVFAFSDGDQTKWGKVFEGKTILSREQLREKMKVDDVILVISSTYFSEIVDDLKKDNISMDKVFSSFAVRLSIFYNIDNTHINDEYRERYKIELDLWKEMSRTSSVAYDKRNQFDTLMGMIKNDCPILVYQVGKVGSTSIHISLQQKNLPSFHVHNFQINYFASSKYKKLYNLAIGKRPIKIISLVREPISRDISSFFQIAFSSVRAIAGGYLKKGLYEDFLDIYYRNLLNAKCESKHEKNENYEEMPVRFKLFETVQKNGNTFDWFDYELKETFGIDVYEYPFDKNKGYSIIEKDGIEVLIMQLEKLSQLEDVIGEFVGDKQFCLVNDNESSGKEYQFLYKEFLNGIVLPQDYIDFYYKNNEAMNHFYSIEDQEKFRRKWKKISG